MIVQTESNQNGKAMQAEVRKHTSLLEDDSVALIAAVRLDCRGAANYQRS